MGKQPRHRIPKEYADKLHWDQNTNVELTIVEGKLVTEAITQPAYRLDELLSAITPENLHSEVSTGHSVGNEAW